MTDDLDNFFLLTSAKSQVCAAYDLLKAAKQNLEIATGNDDLCIPSLRAVSDLSDATYDAITAWRDEFHARFLK